MNLKAPYFLLAITFLTLLFSCSSELDLHSVQKKNPNIPEKTLSEQIINLHTTLSDLIIVSFAGSVANPDFYGLDMESTNIACPTTIIRQNGQVIDLNFSSLEGTSKCNTLSEKGIKGLIKIDKGNHRSLVESNICSPAYLELSDLTLGNTEINLPAEVKRIPRMLAFYAQDNCEENGDKGKNARFAYQVQENWVLDFVSLLGESRFSPVNGTPFLKVELHNYFEKNINFEDWYDLTFRFDLMRGNELILDFNQDQEQTYFIETIEPIFIKPLACKHILAGTLRLQNKLTKETFQIEYKNKEEECVAQAIVCSINLDNKECITITL